MNKRMWLLGATTVVVGIAFVAGAALFKQRQGQEAAQTANTHSEALVLRYAPLHQARTSSSRSWRLHASRISIGRQSRGRWRNSPAGRTTTARSPN